MEQARAAEKDEKLQNTLTLKLKRIDSTLREFQLLHFNVNSARIFFQVLRFFCLEFNEIIVKADDTNNTEDDAKSVSA